ncbi:zinc-binding dehydrogenase [Camelimonas lactis]|uniref:Threonine dehydrogenase-like Zn-dependent dehydrogenase n=1 Tax=Camelimonas lactis TaxID=659006 RepID=A0A4V2RX70_9HYPH|nr:zinc-binding dehydrogenase [Camelimonas lactis]TCO12091.1 threonine dehydrogenase-like Zn-dependent dehydrogenase [Camelimonas lactis]
MRAIVRRAGKLELNGNWPEPTPGPGQTLVKVLACGVCGSDLHALDHLERMSEFSRRCGSASGLDASQGVVFGHEFCGEIIAHGPGSTSTLAPGTRVVAMPFTAGPNGMELIGFSNRFNGGFAERMLLSEALLLPAPDHLPPAVAAMTEPFAVGEHAVAMAKAPQDAVALVLGCGPVGLAVIAAARARGLSPIIASDFSPVRRAAALKLGADIVIDPAVENPYGRWSEFDVPADLAGRGVAVATGRPMRPAVIFECVGAPGMLQAVIEGAPPLGRIVVVGACMEADHIEPLMAINKQLSMEFVFAYTPDEFALTLKRLANGDIDGAAALTMEAALADTPQAFELAKQAGQHVKIVINPQR